MNPFDLLQDLQGKIAFQSEVKQLLGEVPKHMSPVVKALQPPELLNAVFRLAGHLAKHCAAFLYIKVLGKSFKVLFLYLYISICIFILAFGGGGGGVPHNPIADELTLVQVMA